MMTGSVKCRNRLCGPDVHRAHLDGLRRLADSGKRWAHEAMEPRSPLLYVSASGFTDDFRTRAEEEGHGVITWTLADLYVE